MKRKIAGAMAVPLGTMMVMMNEQRRHRQRMRDVLFAVHWNL